MQKRGRLVTLKHFAEQSGYSLRTVKKVMGGKEHVSDETRKRILNIAKKMNYRPNKIASALAKNRKFKLAFVYAHVSKYYFPEVEEGFRKCIEENRDFGLKVEYFKKNDLNAD